MSLPIPTAEEIVQVFIDNGWRKKCGVSGAMKHNVSDKLCCAVPALLVLAGENPLEYFNNEEQIYNKVEALYGVTSVEVYSPFDHPRSDIHKTPMALACKKASIMLDENLDTCSIT